MAASPDEPHDSMKSLSEPQRMPLRSPSEALKPTAPPPPPKRVRHRGGLLARLSALFTFIMVAALAGMGGLYLVTRQVHAPGPLSSDRVVLINKNTGVDEIAEQLNREGVIDRPTLFIGYAVATQKSHKLKAGEYLFKARTSIEEVFEVLIDGKPILHTVTVPEGLTSEQIVARLKENEILTGDLADMPKEGTLLPDTYKFERGMSRADLINRMQREHKRVVNELWARRPSDLPIKTPQEMIILASIIEKETGKADERTRVAGVFLNRLNRKMRLQSDPTIVYGLVGGKGTLGRPIQRAEITAPTPYNTYTIDGLPPGPIANPGRAALEAVINPSRTKELFFVADGTGGHVFAETYDQHQRNVVKWRQIESQRRNQDAVDRIEPSAEPQTRGDLPAGVGGMTPVESAAAFASPDSTGTPGMRRGFDAVEGTAKDPLKNRTYDLNSPKVIPKLGAR